MKKKGIENINKWKRISKIEISTYLSVNPSDINSLNTPIGRCKVAE